MRDGMQDSWLSIRKRCSWSLRTLCLPLVLFLLLSIAALGQSQPLAADTRLSEILNYIHDGWDSLTRSTSSCGSVSDPKLSAVPVLYLPADFQQTLEVDQMQRNCPVTVAHLPEVIHQLGTAGVESIQPPGLLYLKNKYIVPGGRFNEMYGWDSYFIIRGLLRAGRVELARGMVDNFFFEIEHYGAMLNANRTYYLTRSQPPFLSSMFVDVYDAMQKSGHADPALLAKAFSDLEKDYEMWNRDPHLAGDTGLSRYYDFGEGPPAEALQDESGFYRKVSTYFFFHPAQTG